MIHILYTLEIGGDFKHVAQHTDEETTALFNHTVENGLLEYRTGDRIVKVKPSYIALVRDIDNYDFDTQSQRD